MDQQTTEKNIRQSAVNNNPDSESKSSRKTRLGVKKTYKLYINGGFPRSESGRYFRLTDTNGNLLANCSRGSKKDLRDAVVAARKAHESWASRSAYNKGQILYRIAETLEGRKLQFEATLISQGVSPDIAAEEVPAAIDRIVYYAGWTDKYQQLFSSVNPVESSYFNFSYPEPSGIACIIAPVDSGLLGLVSAMCPFICGGNTSIVLASEKYPLTAIELAEVFNASDLPAGVVNLLTGFSKELLIPFSNHMDVNTIAYCGNDTDELTTIRTNAALNVKRVIHWSYNDWFAENSRNPYMILDGQEIKTTWHPIGT